MTRGLSIIFYILIAVITCYLAYGIDNCNGKLYVNGYPTRRNFMNKILISGIFVILFAVSALRFGIGNDYYQYTQTAYEASIGGYVVTEIGFNMLAKLVLIVTGGDYYEVLFAIFAFATIIIFLKAFKWQRVSFFDSFFLFMMFGMYFQTFNTMRYYLALAITFYSMKYVLEKDYIKFVFVIIIAALFHKSVLIVIPVYLIASLEWKRWHIMAGLVASALCYLLKGVLLKAALILYPSYNDTIFLEGGTSLTSIVRITVVLILYGWFMVYCNNKMPCTCKSEGWYKEIVFYGQLNIIAFVTATFFSFLPVITRLVYYFSVNQIVLIPLIVSRIGDEKLRHRLRILIGIIAIIYFIVFLLGADKDGVGLLPYKSWLFTTERYTFR